MKKLCYIISLLALAGSLFAQTTSTTATVTAPDGNVFANGSVTAIFLPPGGIINQNQYTINGAAFPYTVTGTMDGTGTFTIILTDDHLVKPLGGRWQFVVCGLATVSCTTSVQDVFGGSINLSGPISTDVKAINGNGIFVGRFYQDSEVNTNGNAGGIIYFNLVSKVLRYWDGSAWNNFGAGGGAGTGACPANKVVIAVNVGAPTCVTITSTYVDSSIELTSHKNQASGYVGLDGSSNAVIAGSLTVSTNLNVTGNTVLTGNLTVNGILQFQGALDLSSPIPITSCVASGAGNSKFCLQTDGNYYTSNNAGGLQQLVTRAGLGFGAGVAGTAVTTTTKGAGTGPTTPQTIVQYMQISQNGTTYYIPLVQ